MYGGQQGLELGAGDRAPCADDTDAPRLALGHSGFDGRFHAHQRQHRVFCTDVVDGCSGGGIAGNHQGFDVVLCAQVLRDGTGAGRDIAVTPFAVRRVCVVRQVHKVFLRQLGP